MSQSLPAPSYLVESALALTCLPLLPVSPLDASAQELISFHQPCATFCSASWESAHVKCFLLATKYGKTGRQEEVSSRTNILWPLIHRTARSRNSNPDQYFM